MKNIIFLWILLICGFFTHAQVCTGSLGDPTVDINFGAGAGIGPPLAAGITTYNYKSSDCPNDGQYTIANRIPDCFSNSWHQLTNDHTGNANGYMMVVNAANEAGIFYTFSVDNLCPKTNYQLGAYIINLSKPNTCNANPIKPNITFRIETEAGELLKEFNTGYISPTSNPAWQQSAFFFSTPVGVSKIVLKMINNSVGGCGNDLAIDDITFRPCGPNIIAGSANVISNNTFVVCEGANATFPLKAEVSSGFDAPAYQWQINKNDGNGWMDIPNANRINLDAEVLNADVNGYQYRLTVAETENINSLNCRVASTPVTINVSPKLVVDAGKDISVLENQSATFNASAPAGLLYKWTPAIYLDDPNILNPTIKALENTLYTLTVTDAQTGCEAQDQVKVTVEKVVKIPDTFSPNDDGVNDLWEIPTLMGNQEVDIKVFNRDGRIVYQSKGYVKAWDGKLKNTLLPVGVYYYLIDTHSAINNIYKGSITIIR